MSDQDVTEAAAVATVPDQIHAQIERLADDQTTRMHVADALVRARPVQVGKHGDNNGALAIINSGTLNKRSRHTEIKTLLVRESCGAKLTPATGAAGPKPHKPKAQ